MINMTVRDHDMPESGQIKLIAQASLSFICWRASIKKDQFTAKLTGITVDRANLVISINGMLLNHHSTVSI
jgi:hypothetical protein